MAHWTALAPAAQQAALIWVVTRHEIDYRGNVAADEAVTGETWVEQPARGARFDRRSRFVDAAGQPKVTAVTAWALIDRASGRPVRIRPDIADPFLEASLNDPPFPDRIA